VDKVLVSSEGGCGSACGKKFLITGYVLSYEILCSYGIGVDEIRRHS
jgi:hypothetical protein